MQTVHKIEELRKIVSSARNADKSVGLVPTMGYFHEGHLSLMRAARRENDLVVASIFVNPIQFGAGEDLDKYPRDLDRDAQLAESVGVDVIFTPSSEEMYPSSFSTYLDVEKITDALCGARRPGHFRGVATVVLKLLNIVQPDRAYFGMKDYQQLKVIQRMVADLNVPVDIVPMPIVRESDGLAMSSRNSYLSPEERKSALILSKSLARAQELIDGGVTSGEELQHEIEEFIAGEPLAKIEYVSVVHSVTLESVSNVTDKILLALCVHIGKTRLIDNALLTRG